MNTVVSWKVRSTENRNGKTPILCTWNYSNAVDWIRGDGRRQSNVFTE
jgi:hypothetical protein